MAGAVMVVSGVIAFLAATAAVTRFRFRTIPVLVFFVLVQRRLVSGLGGAVKD